MFGSYDYGFVWWVSDGLYVIVWIMIFMYDMCVDEIVNCELIVEFDGC